MIRLERLNLWIGDAHILKDIDLSVETGQTLALVGPSGAGKTSLARLLLRLIDGRHIDDKVSRRCRVRWSGQAIIAGTDVLHASDRQMARLRGRKIGLVVQGLSDALNPQLTVGEHIREMLKSQGSDRRSPEEICGEFNIPQRLLTHRPAELSGGEIQRVLTTLALLPEPDLLILDEPTASLDWENRQQAARILTRNVRERTQILISHDQNLVSDLADRTLTMTQGRIRSRATPPKPVGAPAPKALAQTAGRDREGGTARAPCAEVFQMCAVSHSFGKRQVLSDIGFQVRAGECLAIHGPSGTGKSTLARLVAGFLPLQSGHLVWPNRAVNGLFPTGFVSQLPHRSLTPHFTVRDTIAEAIRLVRGQAEDEVEIAEVLRAVELPANAGFLSRWTRDLSGGEAQRLSLARALVIQPRLLVADEPTSALDAGSKEGVLATLQRAKAERGLAMLVFTHDDVVLSRLADRSLHLTSQGMLSTDARGWRHSGCLGDRLTD